MDKNKQSCGNCFFWERWGFEEANGHGSCKRYPPTVTEYENFISHQPVTRSHGWCGEHKPVEQEKQDNSDKQ